MTICLEISIRRYEICQIGLLKQTFDIHRIIFRYKRLEKDKH